MFRPWLRGLAAAAALALAGPANAVVISDDLPVIDSFEQKVLVIELAIGGFHTGIQFNPAGAVGDRRATVLTTDGLFSALFTGDGNAVFTSTGGDTIFMLDYGISKPLNLSLPGDAFKFEVLESDLDERGLLAPFTTTLTSGPGVVEAAGVLVSGEGSVVIPFTRFPLTNFNDVDYISFSLDTTGIDRARVVIGPIVDPTLPEPATVTLFGFGLLGVVAALCRRKRTPGPLLG